MLNVGVARRTITPPLGIYARSWGAATHDIAEGVHRPLTLTVLTFTPTAAPPFVLASFDLGWWKAREDEALIHEGAAAALGLAPEQLWVHLTHTHAGPSLCTDDADRPGGEHIAPYLAFLRDSLTDAAREALASAVPAVIEYVAGRCDLAQNRDLPEPGGDGTLVGWNPDAPTDDTVGVIRIARPDGTPLAALVHYACHPTVLGPANRLLSPDYIGALRETVEAAIGAPCAFLQGASGGLAAAEQYTADTSIPDRHGRRLAHAALAAWESLGSPSTTLAYERRLDSGAPLAVHQRIAQPTDDTLVIATKRVTLALKPTIGAVGGTQGDRAAQERDRRAAQVRRYVGDGTTTTVPISVIRLADLTLIGIPGESYQDLQAALRAAADHPVLVCNITNGWYGYFPPRAIYERPAVYAAQQSPFAPGCHEQLLEALMG